MQKLKNANTNPPSDSDESKPEILPQQFNFNSNDLNDTNSAIPILEALKESANLVKQSESNVNVIHELAQKSKSERLNQSHVKAAEFGESAHKRRPNNNNNTNNNNNNFNNNTNNNNNFNNNNNTNNTTTNLNQSYLSLNSTTQFAEGLSDLKAQSRILGNLNSQLNIICNESNSIANSSKTIFPQRLSEVSQRLFHFQK